MNREIRISYRNAALIGVTTILIFIYAISGKNECEIETRETKVARVEEKSLNAAKAIIYAVTPTYARPEQQAELIRLKKHSVEL